MSRGRRAGPLQDGGKCCLAHPLWYSTHLQWLLSCSIKPHSCGSNLSQSPKHCWAADKGSNSPPLPLLCAPHRDVAVWRMSHRQVAGHPCLWASVGSNTRAMNSLCALFCHCEDGSYLTIFMKAKLNSSSLCFYFGCHLMTTLAVIPADS